MKADSPDLPQKLSKQLDNMQECHEEQPIKTPP